MTDETVVEQGEKQVDSNAAFEAGFNAERGLPPPAEKPVEAAPAQEPVVEEPKAEVQPDEWEGVSPKVKAELESMRGQLAKVPDRLRNIEGHIGGLTSQLKTALSAKAAVEQSGAAAPSQAQIAQAKTSEKWTQLKEDYPDWAEAMDERLAALPAQAPVDVESLKAKIRSEIEQETGKSLQGVEERAVELAVLRIKDPDWKKKVASPEFAAWHAKQAPEVQALARSTNADDALTMIAKFDAATKAAKKAADIQKDKTQRLQAATTPQGVGAQPLPTQDENAALEAGFKRIRNGG